MNHSTDQSIVQSNHWSIKTLEAAGPSNPEIPDQLELIQAWIPHPPGVATFPESPGYSWTGYDLVLDALQLSWKDVAS